MKNKTKLGKVDIFTQKKQFSFDILGIMFDSLERKREAHKMLENIWKHFFFKNIYLVENGVYVIVFNRNLF